MHISVRVDPETKERLNKLSAFLGINLSDLLRSYIVPLTEASLAIKTVESIRALEKAVLRAIISSREFQQLLREVKKFLREEEFWEGCGAEYKKTVRLVPESFLTIEEEGGVLWPAYVEHVVDGYCDYYPIEKVTTLKELAEWLEDLKRALGMLLHDKIEEVKEAIRKLTS